MATVKFFKDNAGRKVRLVERWGVAVTESDRCAAPGTIAVTPSTVSIVRDGAPSSRVDAKASEIRETADGWAVTAKDWASVVVDEPRLVALAMGNKAARESNPGEGHSPEDWEAYRLRVRAAEDEAREAYPMPEENPEWQAWREANCYAKGNPHERYLDGAVKWSTRETEDGGFVAVRSVFGTVDALRYIWVD